MKPRLIVSRCTRCGAPVTTAKRSIVGLDDLKSDVGIVCGCCYSEDELWRLQQRIGSALVGRIIA